MKKILTIKITFLVIILVSVLPLTAFATENTRSTALEFDINDGIAISFDKDDCEMWCKFVAPETGTFNVEIIDPYYDDNTQDWETYLYVYDSRGNELDFSGVDDFMEACTSTVECNAGETYYLTIHNYADKNYTLHVSVKKHIHNLSISGCKAEIDGNYYYSGYLSYSCKDCDYYEEKTIPAIKSISIAKSNYTYSGSYNKPSVTVKNKNGKIVKSVNYKVSYSNNKNVGKGKVKITFKGDSYFGSSTKTFKINPKGTTLGTMTALKSGFKATWKKQATQTTGYQIRYSSYSGMGSSKMLTISKNTILSKSIKNLKAKKKYYVQVRTYKTVNGVKYCSAWSAKKTITTK